MKYNVKAFANIRYYLPLEQEDYEFNGKDNLTVSEILTLLNIPDSEVMLVKVNDQVVSRNYSPKEKEILEIFPTLSGG